MTPLLCTILTLTCAPIQQPDIEAGFKIGGSGHKRFLIEIEVAHQGFVVQRGYTDAVKNYHWAYDTKYKANYWKLYKRVPLLPYLDGVIGVARIESDVAHVVTGSSYDIGKRLSANGSLGLSAYIYDSKGGKFRINVHNSKRLRVFRHSYTEGYSHNELVDWALHDGSSELEITIGAFVEF